LDRGKREVKGGKLPAIIVTTAAEASGFLLALSL
jgi:hypothetical protein